MSIVLTAAEIATFRSALSSLPDALEALDVIEDCEGDLEDAAIVLAIRAKQQPSNSDRWLEGLAKRWRSVLCRPDLKANLEDETSTEAVSSIVNVVQFLMSETAIPDGLATPLVIYVLKVGVGEFCKVLAEKLV